jgi:hypothetical protein
MPIKVDIHVQIQIQRPMIVIVDKIKETILDTPDTTQQKGSTEEKVE